ncbi:MAG: replicative DNA helicase [Erysipelotrichaceae bacterium]|nr:replicative DNA helicase [Erysipelotrichaceae bacterium]
MAKQMPNSVDVEQSLLGSMLLYPESVRIVFEKGLMESDFYSNVNQRIFNVIMGIDNEKKPVEITGVVTRLTDLGLLQQVGGMEYLLKLVDMATSPANCEYYISLVQNKAILRRLIESAQEISEEGMDLSNDIEDVLDLAEQKILNVTRSRRTTDFRTGKQVVQVVLKELENLQQNRGLTGIPTNFERLDYMTNGFQRGDLIILAARPSMGKTAFALNLGLNAATIFDKTVAIFSLEMPSEQLVKRMLSSKGAVQGSKLKNGYLDNRDWNNLYDAAQELQQAKIFLDDSSTIRMSDIFSKCRKLKSEHGLDIVIIDYLQLISGGKKTESRQQEVSEISRSLKQLARELEVPVIALSQLSRKTEQRPGEDKRPILSDLRESGSIEQDADLVMFLHSADYYKKDKPEIRSMQVIVAKHRNGAVGDVDLTFEPGISTFFNAAKKGEEMDES